MNQVSCIIFVTLLLPALSTAAEWKHDLQEFIEESCVSCHDVNTDTQLDLESLGYDFENEQVFESWVHVFDRVQRGEMPPASEDQPSKESSQNMLSLLKGELVRVNQARYHTVGRVPSRRLSRQEYEHTLRELLMIGGDLAKYLPPESDSGTFDVVASTQEMSSIHVKGFLKAADVALDEAIQLGAKPKMVHELDYANSRYMKMWFERPVRNGGGTVFRAGDDLIMFRGENHKIGRAHV